MQITKDSSGNGLAIAGDLSIGVAAELQAALREYLQEVPEPVLELSGVESCDAAGFQCFYSASRTAEKAGKGLNVAGIPEAMRATAEELGLDLGVLTHQGGAQHAE